MDWDDYRYFSAIARAGSVRGAALEMGVNASTVTRRLERLETDLGTALFLRTGKGLNITTEGVEVSQRVDDVAQQLRLLEASLKGKDSELSGRITVSVPDVLANSFWIGDLAPFIDMYREIELSLLPSIRPLPHPDEVDVRISVTDEPPEWMIGRRLGRIGLAAYASPTYLASKYQSSGPTWVTWSSAGEMSTSYAALQQRFFPNIDHFLNCDQVEMQRAALRADVGIGILPIFVGEADPGLQRLDDMPVQESPSLWVLTHPNARSTRKIQVFLAYLREIFANRQGEVFV